MCCVTVHIAPAVENVTVLREAIHVNVTDSILEMFASTKVELHLPVLFSVCGEHNVFIV